MFTVHRVVASKVEAVPDRLIPIEEDGVDRCIAVAMCVSPSWRVKRTNYGLEDLILNEREESKARPKLGSIVCREWDTLRMCAG